MSFDDDVFANMHTDLFATFGIDAVVTRVSKLDAVPGPEDVTGTVTESHTDPDTGIVTSVVTVTDIAAATKVITITVAKPVRVVINRGNERMGEYGQVVGRVDTVDFLLSQHSPAQDDRLAWVDRLGAHDKSVESLGDNDGFIATAVLHG